MDKNNKIYRMKELIIRLNDASIAYYNTGDTVMSDREFDKLYDELKQLEEETNTILANSPTHKVGAEVISKLETVKHNHPMLSLDKCHTEEELIKFAGNRDCLLMFKMDGLTVSLEYDNGELISAETRGNGEEGSNIIHNALVFKNIPMKINNNGNLIIDGEAIITYDDFDRINESLPDDKKYKNPRNLASGSVTLLDSSITAKRNIKFIAWRVIKGLDNIGQSNSNYAKLKEIEKLGFDIVPMWTYSNNPNNRRSLNEMLSNLRLKAEELSYPIDGAVMLTDSISECAAMGRTDKFFRHSIAYKFEDEKYSTKLLDIEWTMGKTGILTPTAVFEPVLIDGTNVTRASLHNVSILESLGLRKGCTVNVYKANMIIPQISSVEFNGNETDSIRVPDTCPICGSKTEIRKDNNTKFLICSNTHCNGKLLGRLKHFTSKNAMNIEGLSDATLGKFVSLGWLTNLSDLYKLSEHKIEMYGLEGLGKKSVDKLLAAIDKSKHIKFDNFLYSLSIPLIGKSASKTISKYCNGSADNFIKMIKNNFNFAELEDFGVTMHESITKWFDNYDNSLMFAELINIMEFIVPNAEVKTNTILNGKSFCITGKFLKYSNRNALVEDIESHGGKVVSGVTKVTDYLITNDTTSGSSKNVKAEKLNIPIINEDDLIKMIK